MQDIEQENVDNTDILEEEMIEDCECLDNLESPQEENINYEEIIESLLDDNKKLREDYLRAFADAENTKRRAAQEIEKNNKYAISSFAKNLLTVSDNLQRAIDCVTEEQKKEQEAFLQGVELTQSDLMSVFNKFGIVKMDTMGQIFDPNYHQVIQEVPDPSKTAGTVIAEIQTGYMIQDRILREAMVVVAK